MIKFIILREGGLIMLEKIMNDKEINSIIGHVNDIIIINNCGDHGFGHVLKVMEYMEILLIGLGADEHTIELGKIAAYLHDIGAIMGKDGHAERSADFAEKYLKKIGMNDNDLKIEVNAIRNHSTGANLDSVIGACLTLADKIDMRKSRMMRFIDGICYHDNVKHVIETKLYVDSENIVIDIITDGMFDYNCLREQSKVINKPVEMAKYLKRNCLFKIDGQIIDLYSIINSSKNY